MIKQAMFSRVTRSFILILGLSAGWEGVAARGESKIVIAHRGACGYLPEHTLESTALAHAMGAHFIEQDVVLTKDGVPIVVHDVYLDAVSDVAQRYPHRERSDGRHYAIDFTLDEIKRLRVSTRFDPGTGRPAYPGRFPVRHGHFQVPTLDEAIELIQGLNQSRRRNVGVYTEVKSPAWHREHGKDISRIVLDTLARYGYTHRGDQAYVQCFDEAEVRRMRLELKSDLKLVQLLDGNAFRIEPPPVGTGHVPERLARIAQYADGIGPPLDLIVRGVGEDGQLILSRLVEESHRRGLEVHPYTFRADALPEYADDFDQLLRIFCVDVGVDGLFTDFPDRAVEVLK